MRLKTEWRGWFERFTLFMVLLTIMLVTGCAVATKQGFEQNVNSWTGHHIDGPLMQWGTPLQVTELSDGKLYHWREMRYLTKGFTYKSVMCTGDCVPPAGFAMNNQAEYCDLYLRTDADGIITGNRFHGTVCTARATQ